MIGKTFLRSLRNFFTDSLLDGEKIRKAKNAKKPNAELQLKVRVKIQDAFTQRIDQLNSEAGTEDEKINLDDLVYAFTRIMYPNLKYAGGRGKKSKLLYSLQLY